MGNYTKQEFLVALRCERPLEYSAESPQASVNVISNVVLNLTHCMNPQKECLDVLNETDKCTKTSACPHTACSLILREPRNEAT